MGKCVNENCKNNPMKSMNAICVNEDGDFACCPRCKEEFEKQRDEFFENICNDDWYESWMSGRL